MKTVVCYSSAIMTIAFKYAFGSVWLSKFVCSCWLNNHWSFFYDLY